MKTEDATRLWTNKICNCPIRGVQIAMWKYGKHDWWQIWPNCARGRRFRYFHRFWLLEMADDDEAAPAPEVPDLPPIVLPVLPHSDLHAADWAIADFVCPQAGSIFCFHLQKRVLVSGGLDGIIRTWDLQTEKCCIQLSGHEQAIKSLIVKDNLLYSGDSSGNIRVWDIETEECLHSMNEHTQTVSSLHLVGDYLYSTSYDNTVHMWDASTLASLRKLEGHLAPVTCAAVNPDEPSLIYSGSWDRTIRLWDTRTALEPGTEPIYWGEPHSVHSLCLNNGVLFAGGGDCKIRAWDLAVHNHPRLTMWGHKGWVLSLKFSHGALYSGADDCTIKRWDLKYGVATHTMHGHRAGVQFLHDEDGVSLFSGSSDACIRAWDVTRLEQQIVDIDVLRTEEIRKKMLADLEAEGGAKKKGKKGKKK
eukprot:TRINITY_DN213_c0_g1_i2.p1 TRINITY_DN213_c0_g1~~TRINITY_DN213_c0_g1_i2.p1  ORF type:complete len:419 (-),score=48.63 TRINITY_DN213_c0_g1_i2:1179-2435(-)